MAWQDKNPWEMSPEELAQASGGAAPRARTAPTIIQGPPKTMDPGETERLRLSQNSDARAAQANDRANAAAERAARAAEKQSVSLNENQGKASGFYISARGAEREWKALEADPELAAGTQPVGIMGDVARAVLPTNVINSNTSAARQRAQQAKDNFIRASLRLESGAAIGPSEFARQDRIFYPQTGDSPETLQQKARARQEVIDGFRIQAGPGAERVDEIPQPTNTSGQDTTVILGDEEKPLTGYRFTPEQQGQIEEAIRAGDEGQALALMGKFSGNPAISEDTRKSVQATIVNIRKNPRAPVDFNYGPVDTAAQAAADKERFGNYLPQAIKERPASNVDAAVRGVADAATLGFADELAALGNTVVNGKTYTDNLQRERAIDEADERVNPIVRTGGQLAAAAIPTGRWLGFGRSAAPRSALSFAGEGGVLGGLYAAGSADPAPAKTLAESLQARATAAPTGAALGGGAAYGLAALGNGLRSRANHPGGPPPGGQDAVDIAQSAADERIPISRPIVDPSRRDAMSYLESSIGSGGPVRRSLDATREGIETRAGELGDGGVAQAPGVIGERVQEAGNRYIERSRGVGGRLYDRAAQMAGNNPVHPREAVRVIDEQIAELSGNANQNAPMIRYLEEVRGDLVDDAGNIRDKAIGDIRDIRTNLRGNINTRNLSATDAERRVGMVLDAARSDIQRDLGQAAPAAVRQYARADRFWQERQSEIKQVVQKVIGQRDNPLGGEQVWQRIRTMASDKGDSERLQRVWNKLQPEDRADAAATIAGTLGRRSADEEFSPALFVNSVRGLSASARQTIFGPEGARSIANLRRVAEAYRDTAARLNNSRSGQVMQWGRFLGGFVPTMGGGAMVGGLPGAVGGATLTGAGALAKNLTARALMSPDMSRWLANAPRQTTPSAIASHIARLSSVVARRDPAIAQDALGLQRYLQEAISSSPRRAAAADEEKQ